MMLTELLANLRDLNVHLSVEGDNLKCKAPPNVLTAELRGQLKNRKQELIAALSHVNKASHATIEAMPRNALIPLSFAQQRLWFLDQLEPNSAFYNMTIALRLTGKLHIAAVAQSFTEIVRRHESLRTAFVILNNQPAQKIISPFDVPVAFVDLRALPEQQRQGVALNLCKLDAEKPFVLAEGGLMRVTLIRLSNKETILLVALHHIAVDGWSSDVLNQEFTALYQAFCTGQASPLPELTIQYADFAYWQRNWLAGDVLQQQSQYWQQHLHGSPALLELPTDYPRPPVMTHNGANYEFVIPDALAESIHTLGHKHQTTLFMTLLASFMVLLARYSQRTDLCVGTPFANRHRLELENLIGFFVNTLVIRADLAAAPNFEQLLNQIKSTVLDAEHHQDLPFEQLVEILQPERNRSYSPLFQVMFVLQNAVAQSLQIADLQINHLQYDGVVSKFDLTLHICPASEHSLIGTFEYNTDLFAKSSIARLAEHYLTLLQAIVTQPQARLLELPLLTAAERQQMLVDWNATGSQLLPSFPRSSVGTNPAPLQRCETLHELFEQQAEKNPNALAVVFEEQALTYAELNARANQLARYLQQQGVVADTLVGLCVERGLNMIVGLLGILKSGGAYLPLDPAYPKQRLAYMLEDTQANIVLTQQTLIATLSDMTSNTQLVCLDSDWADIAVFDTQNLNHHLHPLNLAYIIYTSGSTGKPKGVLVSQGNAVHSTTARFNTYQEPVRGYLLLSSFAFDSSIAGLFWTLGQGGCLCLPTDEQSKDPHSLGELIATHEISHLLALPSLYALLLKQATAQLHSLKVAIVAGEACSTETVKQHYTLLPQVKLYNEYGPTENSVWSSVYLTDAEDTAQAVSIGRPIVNVQIYLLDAHYHPVPIGVVGEIYLGGAGIARGYLHQADLTAEKFIPDPFSQTGQRLYKTGDLAKYRADGCIEFLGRVDHQVKVRGFRIELGEIEARLLELPDVQETVVLARDQQLIAYIVGTATEANLRKQLKSALPDYMIPNVFVFLEALPLTANGKLNRNALPLPNFNAVSTDYSPPTTATEKMLSDIWQQLLHVERIGIHDDFFALGGHSLLATQLLFAVRNTASLATDKFTLKNFFEQPTIAAQAKIITGDVSDEQFDFVAEVSLDADIVPLTSEPISVAEASAIFLTGATGFLGAFLLADLLAQSTADIYCLIRANDETQAMQRLKQQLQRFELLERVDCSRIIAVCGDLAEPQLGLTDTRYQEIAERVSVIYHNGALVNFIQPYTQLKPANVKGTQAVLGLACTKNAKAIHYVSTLSVFSELTPPHCLGFSEQDEAKLTEYLDDGYSQSKWVAEKIMLLASKRGFPVSIYRPATVAGDSINGVWNSDDFLCRLLKGCLQLGSVPNANQRIELAPVDYISKAIVKLSQQVNSVGACFHLNSPYSTYTQDVLDWFQTAGYRFERVSYAQWVKKLLRDAENIENFALAPLLSLFADEPNETEEIHEDTPRYDCRATQNALFAVGIDCPLVNDTLLKSYLSYFIRSEFFLPSK
jgi:myxalamid-type nonribosomal peptide synthetase MxaA